MKAVSITPKTVEVIPAKTATFSSLIWRTTDDGFARKLQIVVNNQYVINIEGSEYDELGQWTDDTVKQLILKKYDLTEA